MWSIVEFEHRNIEQNFPFRINHDGKMDFIREDIPSDFPCCIWQTKIFAIIIFFFFYIQIGGIHHVSMDLFIFRTRT